MIKQYNFLFFSLLLFSCSPSPDVVIQKDCNCNKVVSVVEFNGVGYKFGRYYTINECTGVQNDYSWTGSKPNIGECK